MPSSLACRPDTSSKIAIIQSIRMLESAQFFRASKRPLPPTQNCRLKRQKQPAHTLLKIVVSPMSSPLTKSLRSNKMWLKRMRKRRIRKRRRSRMHTCGPDCQVSSKMEMLLSERLGQLNSVSLIPRCRKTFRSYFKVRIHSVQWSTQREAHLRPPQFYGGPLAGVFLRRSVQR